MSEIQTMVVCAFPGCGKTYSFKNEKDKYEGVLDSDSSQFSWIINSLGEKERNPNFPQNYIEHIKSNIGKVEVIFVSSHIEVRQALKEAGIKYVLVYPNIYQKDDYIKRYIQRGNDKKFINVIKMNWEEWITSCNDDDYGICIPLPYFSCKYLNKEVIELIKIMEGDNL